MSKEIKVCPTCKGTGVGEESRVDKGGGTHGRDHWYRVDVPCTQCEASGLVEVETIIIIRPYKPTVPDGQ